MSMCILKLADCGCTFFGIQPNDMLYKTVVVLKEIAVNFHNNYVKTDRTQYSVTQKNLILVHWYAILLIRYAFRLEGKL